MSFSRLSKLCTLSIVLAAGGMTIAGFGTPLVLTHANANVRTAYGNDLVKSYEKPDDMLTDGWLATDNGYLEVAAICSQPGRPPTIKVGIRGTGRSSTHIVKVTPTSTVAGTVYSGTINGSEWSYTLVAADDTIPEVVAALVTAINAATAGLTAAAVGSPVTHLTLTSDTAGQNISIVDLSTNLTIDDTTADPGIATDLAAIEAFDSDWYALLIDGYGAAEIAAVATWIEANKRACFFAQTSDSDVPTSSSDDIASTLKTADRFRTVVSYQYDMVPGLASGIVGSQVAQTPGSYTLHLKSVAGALPSDGLTNPQTNYLDEKRCSYYLTTAGEGQFYHGYNSGGEYFDVVQMIDWTYARMQEATFAALRKGGKTPYTPAGLSRIQTALQNVLNLGVRNGGFTDDPAPQVTVPSISSVSAADKAARRLTGVTFTATLQGAIHFVSVAGTISQ